MSEPESPLAALEQLSAEVGVSMDDLRRTVEQALAVAYKRAFEPPGDVSVRLVPETGEIEVLLRRREADGSVTEHQLPVDDFKRLAAQTARSAVMRHLRDLERERALSELARRQGELASGVVDRIDEGGTVYVDLGKVEGWMPPEEQIPGERLRPGRPVTVAVLEPQGRRGQVRVSRSSRIFVLRLLDAEVPEIANGIVQVRGIAREPGLRTKVAVTSREPSVDPVGACVGPRDRPRAGAARSALPRHRPRRAERSVGGQAHRLAGGHQGGRGEWRGPGMSRSAPASAVAGRPPGGRWCGWYGVPTAWSGWTRPAGRRAGAPTCIRT